MRPVTVRILHPEAGPRAGAHRPRWLAGRACPARSSATSTGSAQRAPRTCAVVSGPPDATLVRTERLRDLVRADRPAGLVVLGSGAIPLATAARPSRPGRGGTVPTIARSPSPTTRYSADVVAIAAASSALGDVPDLPSDERAAALAGRGRRATRSRDLRRRWRLAVDIDGPLDLVLLGAPRRRATTCRPGRVRAALSAVGDVAARSTRPELLVAGRTSAATIAWLERSHVVAHARPHRGTRGHPHRDRRASVHRHPVLGRADRARRARVARGDARALGTTPRS